MKLTNLLRAFTIGTALALAVTGVKLIADSAAICDNVLGTYAP